MTVCGWRETARIMKTGDPNMMFPISLIILLITMIIIGGLTRLTDSGLSITKWDLFQGIFWPQDLQEWQGFAFSLIQIQ